MEKEAPKYIPRKECDDEKVAKRREQNAMAQRKRRERLSGAKVAGEVSPEDPLEDAAIDGFEACMESFLRCHM